MEKVDQKYLKSIFFYDENIGDFVRTVKTSNRINIGDIAGYKDDFGYLIISINTILYRAHRLAWLYVYGIFPVNDIGHENGIKNDNRIANLRDITNAENHKNMRLSSRNSSGVTGVKWYHKQKKWIARIYSDGKEVHLGSFSDFNEAVKERKLAEKRFGFHPNHGKHRNRDYPLPGNTSRQWN